MAIALRYAARSDVGLVRSTNQDSGYAGPRLLVVADGMGGHAAGDVASSVTVAELAPLDDDPPGPDLLDALNQRARAANEHLHAMTEDQPELSGMGTTLTAILRAGTRLGLLHIGDSRCYLLREGRLTQITRDDTFVQSLIDEGRITPEEAAHHPQRNVLMNVLNGELSATPSVSVREARIGDRYLLCSDGLSGVVSVDTIQECLSGGPPDDACDRLVDLALRGGGPDNITCIVADVVEVDTNPPSTPQVVGAASDRHTVTPRRPGAARPSAAQRAAALTAAKPSPEGPDEPSGGTRAGRRPPRLLIAGVAVISVLVLAAAAWFGVRTWALQQYFVGATDGQVAIFRGLAQSLGALKLSQVYQEEDIALAALPDYARSRVQESIPATSLTDAQRIVAGLRTQANLCSPNLPSAPPPTSGPTGTPTPAPTASPPASLDCSGSRS
ncbi:MAG: PP2C family protein-serine/threonine phosphatase [Actinomycetales bacterium]